MSGCKIANSYSKFLGKITVFYFKKYIFLKGGAICSQDASEITIENSIFENNTSPTLGGAIAVQERTKLILNNNYFKKNIAFDGSVLLAFDLFEILIEVKNCTFEKNIATNTMIDLSYSSISIANCSFINNLNPSLFVLKSSLQISNLIVINSTCQTLQLGCVICSDENSIVNIFSLVIVNANAKKTDSGAIYALNTTLNIENAIFQNCFSLGIGTCIYTHNSLINITQSNFSNYNPSCIYAIGGNLTLYKINMGNSFVDKSPIISIFCENTYIEQSNFFNNTGADQGGVLLFQNNYNIKKALIRFSNFTDNTVYENGGSIFIINHSVEIVESLFINNKAFLGGAIYFNTQKNDSGDLILNKVQFQSNTAIHEGGAIKSTFKLPIRETTVNLMNNKALYGKDYASYPIRIQFRIYETRNNTSNFEFCNVFF